VVPAAAWQTQAEADIYRGPRLIGAGAPVVCRPNPPGDVHVACAKDQSNTLDRYSEIFGPDAAMSNLRIGRFRRSKKLVEQVQFGETAVWDETMDAGQSASTPLKASRVKPGDLALSAAKLSFEMVWAISDELKLADAKPRSGKARKK
jgi:hypothetical protein